MLGKDFRYDEVVDLIEKIGYKQRIGNYYIITEDDGYINISYGEEYNDSKIIISFHKNHYNRILDKNGFYKKDISHKFYNFKSFEIFINEYHKDLFKKIKLEKIINNINGNN